MDNNIVNKKDEKEMESGAGFEYSKDKGSSNLYNEKSTSKISPRTLFGVLLFLGAGTLILGFVSLGRNIYAPGKIVETPTDQVEQANIIDELMNLQNADTDKDGLTDYDEEYVYGTSPYLSDTDSDGYSDKEEIENGYDPLCPTGQDCRGLNSGDQTIIEDEEVDEEIETAPLPQEMVDELSNLTADEVRLLLLESGVMTADQLGAIDDESLMTVFQEILNDSAQN